MSVDREGILNALLALAATAPGWQTVGQNPDGSRARLEHWGEVAAQPALYVDDGDEMWPNSPSGVPQKPELEAELWIYCSAPDPDTAAATVMNQQLAALEDALAPQPFYDGRSIQNVQTLGRSDVVHARIEGRVRKYSGHLEGQAIAIVPVKILVLLT